MIKKQPGRLALTTICLLLCVFLGSSKALSRTSGNTSIRSFDASETFNLGDFGAIGDGIADDGPAIQSALDALAAAGGGTLFVPDGRYAIETPVSKDFSALATSITILGVESNTPIAPPTSWGSELAKGLDLVSEFYPRTGNLHAITISGLQAFLIKDIAFVGTQSVVTDASVTLYLSDIDRAVVRHCEFYGLASIVANGAIIKAVRSHLIVDQCKFLGSTCASGHGSPVIQNLEWRGITVTHTHFADYGLRPDFYAKTSLAAPLSWINIGNAAVPESDSPRREVIIREVFLDEGGYYGLTSNPYYYTPPSAPIDLIYITGLRMNVSNFRTSGHFFYDAQGVMVEKSLYEWSHNADAAISLINVGNAILDQLTCLAS